MIKKILTIAICIIAVIAIIFIVKSSGGNKQPVDTTNNSEYNLVGRYSPYEVVMYPLDYTPERDPEPATTTCPAFTVYSGDEVNISNYKKLVSQGNTVNHIDTGGHLVINISTNTLSPDQKNLLTSSSTENITLTVKNKDQSGKDANYCSTFVEITAVKK